MTYGGWLISWWSKMNKWRKRWFFGWYDMEHWKKITADLLPNAQ